MSRWIQTVLGHERTQRGRITPIASLGALNWITGASTLNAGLIDTSAIVSAIGHSSADRVCRPKLVYVSGALTAAPDIVRARAFYEQLAAACRAAGWTAYLPHERTDPQLHTNVTADKVFETDRDLVESCELVVADVGVPSAGVGGELVLAWKAGKPIVAVHHQDQTVSRFVLGLLSVAGATVINYEDEHDCAQRLAAELRSRDHVLGPQRP